MRRHRRLLILTMTLIFLSLVAAPRLSAQELQPYLENDRVLVAAPRAQFLAGRALERLRNGATVPFSVVLSALAGGKTVAQSSGRVVMSFDLWEERFLVVQDSPRRTHSHLSAEAAAARTLDTVSLPLSPLAACKSFVLKLEVRAEDEPDRSDADSGNPGLSMAGLIDVFSRKAKEQPSHWSATSGPLRAQDLNRKSPAGRDRNGASQPPNSRGRL
jgi:hypothetical protein